MKPGEPLVPDEFTDELIRETAVAQGLPFFVEDESALDRFATLMAHANPGLASATPDPSSVVRRGAGGPGIGAAAALRGSGAVGRSKTDTKKAADADTSTASKTAAGSSRRQGAV